MIDPFEPFKNPDGNTYNGLKLLAQLSGLSEDEVQKAWDRVKSGKKE